MNRTTGGGIVLRVLAGRLLLFWQLIFIIIAPQLYAAEKIAVLFPDITGPYRVVFDSVLEGIKSQNDTGYLPYPLSETPDLTQLQQKLTADNPAAVIALGKRGYITAAKLKLNRPTVAGAVPLVPDGIPGISLATDPEVLFSRLTSLAPNSRRVFVVYSPKLNGWLIPLAEAAAQKYGLKLISLAANDLREAMLQYRDLLQDVHSRQDAIWLPADHITVNDEVVLPFLLQEAWDKELAIFSSKPTHVQRGALFALYPDYRGLGRDLAKMVQGLLAQTTPAVVMPLKQLQIAVNLRTASHLGLSLDPREQQNFDLTFPSQ